MPRWKAGIRLAPLRPFDRIVAGYATLAFAVGAGESAVMREWSVTLVGVAMAALGVALLLHDHRRWRAERRTGAPAAAPKRP